MTEIRIVPTNEKYVAGFQRCVDVVARERKYLALVEGPSADGARGFVMALIEGAGVQVLALDEYDVVVGWCDIVINPKEGFRHGGQLGMGVLPSARGQGLGGRLAEAAIQRAWDIGLERVELEVFASNERAIALYRRLGFSVEGVKEQSRKIDGTYDDIIMMALQRTHGGT